MLAVYFVTGGDDEADELVKGASGEAQSEEVLDADAKAVAYTAQTAVETFATDNDGSYLGVTTEDLQAIDPLPDTISVEGGDADYTVVAVSETGTSFAITRQESGTVSLTCDAPGEGGCPSSGDWAQ